MLVLNRVLAHFAEGAPGRPGLHMERVMGLVRLVFLVVALASVPNVTSRLAEHPVLGSLALAAYAAIVLAQLLSPTAAGEHEEDRYQVVFVLELLVVIALIYLYAPALPVLFVLFFFPLVGFFHPISIKTALFTGIFLSALYVGLLHVIAPDDYRSGAFGTLLLLAGGVAVGYLGEKGRWSSLQLTMFRRCDDLLKMDVSFDELLANLLKETALYFPVERVLLIASEADAGAGRLKQARSVGGEATYEEIEFLREEVQYLFPQDVFSGFYLNDVGAPAPDGVQYDFLQNRTVLEPRELPKIFATLFNVRSVLSSPILRQDRALGRIFLLNRNQGRFTLKDILFLKQVCDRYLRPIMENLQLMAKSQALAVLEERNRIAMDLHDSFIQTLATLDVRLEVSRRILEKDKGAGVEELRRMSQMVKSEYLELRRYMNKLRHYEPEISKLEEVLEGFIRKFQEDHGLPVHMTINRSRGPLAESLRGEILQIVREGLTNVVRHAEAKKATLTIDVEEEMVRIRIEDDGRGMPEPNGDGVHVGPTLPWTILQRTQRLSGNLQVDSVPGEGTRISVSIPLRRTS